MELRALRARCALRAQPTRRTRKSTDVTGAYVAYLNTNYTIQRGHPMKKNTVPTYTETFSVRLTPAEAQRVCEMANTGRRTLSQTLRLLLDPVLHTPQQAA